MRNRVQNTPKNVKKSGHMSKRIHSKKGVEHPIRMNRFQPKKLYRLSHYLWLPRSLPAAAECNLELYRSPVLLFFLSVLSTCQLVTHRLLTVDPQLHRKKSAPLVHPLCLLSCKSWLWSFFFPLSTVTDTPQHGRLVKAL